MQWSLRQGALLMQVKVDEISATGNKVIALALKSETYLPG